MFLRVNKLKAQASYSVNKVLFYFFYFFIFSFKLSATLLNFFLEHVINFKLAARTTSIRFSDAIPIETKLLEEIELYVKIHIIP